MLSSKKKKVSKKKVAARVSSVSKKKVAAPVKSVSKKKIAAPVKSVSKKKHPGILDEIHSVESPDLKLEPVSEDFNSVSFPEIFNFIRKSYTYQRRSKQPSSGPEIKYTAEKKQNPFSIEELDTQVRNLFSDLIMAIINTGDQKRFESLINEYRDFLNDLNTSFKNR
jgi:hypothetical protein